MWRKALSFHPCLLRALSSSIMTCLPTWRRGLPSPQERNRGRKRYLSFYRHLLSLKELQPTPYHRAIVVRVIRARAAKCPAQRHSCNVSLLGCPPDATADVVLQMQACRSQAQISFHPHTVMIALLLGLPLTCWEPPTELPRMPRPRRAIDLQSKAQCCRQPMRIC